MLTDCHLHLIDKSQLHYPWLETFEPLNRNFLYDAYAIEAKRIGISRVLHMEVDVAPDDMERETDFIRALSEQPDSLISGAISSCRPEEKDFPEFLERAVSDPFIKGLRRVLHVMPDDLSEGALFRENIKRLSATRLTFDLCVLPHQIEKALALVDLSPDVQFILDHCGVPAIASGAFDDWEKGIRAIAQRPNVLVKISGIVAYADAGSWDVETLRPYVDTVTSAFGFKRMVWGSDWPVCTLGGTLSTWVAATHALFAGASESERLGLFSANASRLWAL